MHDKYCAGILIRPIESDIVEVFTFFDDKQSCVINKKLQFYALLHKEYQGTIVKEKLCKALLTGCSKTITLLSGIYFYITTSTGMCLT